MHTPPHFAEDRPEVLQAAMREIGFALLVTPDEATPRLSHLPFVLREEAGTLVLESHVARANPHWRDLPARASVAVFQGPHAYISPGWYPGKRDGGRVVPTWNYIAVHAHGRLEAVGDSAWLRAHLARLVDANEAGRPEPWHLDEAPERYLDTMMRGIVGLRLQVERLEGKWKMSQNKTPADRQGAMQGLQATGRARDAAVARVMRALENGRQPD